jgi:hypothetical protein
VSALNEFGGEQQELFTAGDRVPTNGSKLSPVPRKRNHNGSGVINENNISSQMKGDGSTGH